MTTRDRNAELTRLRAKTRWLDTGSTRWRRIRASILARDPLCVMCPPKRRQMSTIVDHVNGRADRPEDYADDNLQGLCWSCHSSKTGHQRAGTTAENKGCDEAGNPLAGWRR
jgi:5-methylcytosine-specific restriction protein A